MKKVIFEQPADTIQAEELKGSDLVGVQIQNTKAVIIKDGQDFIPVLKNLSTVPVYKFTDFARLSQFEGVYKFDTLPELIEWLNE